MKPKEIKAIQKAIEAPKIPAKAQFVAYYRVSTDKQGESRLGLEAQKEAVARLARSGTIFAEYTEVESGKRHQNRPELQAAIEATKKHCATLLIAKLDRLARNVHFISGLMESDIDFVAADMPQANRLTVHIMAAFAEHEARAISERTKAALAALKARGVKLGNRNWRKSLAKARLARSANMPRPSEAVLYMMHRHRLECGSYRAIAARLNEIGVKTPSGKSWHASTVRAAMKRSLKT